MPYESEMCKLVVGLVMWNILCVYGFSNFPDLIKTSMKRIPSSIVSNSSTSRFPLFQVVSETKVYNGWRKVIKKDVIMPNGAPASFDIFSQGAPSIAVFIWDRKTKTTTLIQEYYPGLNKVMYGTVGGVFEPKKHKTPLECAQLELEEEAQLRSENWIPLMEGPENSIPFDKYSDNILHPFMVLDCEDVVNPRPIDLEEWIVIERGVSYTRLMEIVMKGEMTLPITLVALLGVKRLQEMGEPLS